MTRDLLRATLTGIVILAIVGLVGELFGPVGVLVLVAGEAVGLGALLFWDAWRTDRANRALARKMAEHALLGFRPRPIGRVSRTPLGFPDRAIVPTRDAHFGE